MIHRYFLAGGTIRYSTSLRQLSVLFTSSGRGATYVQKQGPIIDPSGTGTVPQQFLEAVAAAIGGVVIQIGGVSLTTGVFRIDRSCKDS